MNKYYLPSLEDVVKDKNMLDSFDVNNIELETLMWQTGYLTICEVNKNYDDTLLYRLALPNKDVKIALMGTIAEYMTKTGKQAVYRA